MKWTIGTMQMSKKFRITSVATMALCFTVVTTACCPNSPIDALNGALTLQSNVDPSAEPGVQLHSLAVSLDSMSSCEMAAVMNFIGGGGWTEEEALTVQGVMSQIDEAKADQLALLSQINGDSAAEGIQQAFATVLIIIPIETAALLKDMFDAFKQYTGTTGGNTGGGGLLPIPPLPPLF